MTEHPLNEAIDRMIERDRISEADVLLVKVREQCMGVALDDLRVAILVHRANCHQPSCPVLAAMERVEAEQRAKSSLRTCPGCGRRFAMLYICERCGRCDAQDLRRDADRDACCAGDDTCVEHDWRSEAVPTGPHITEQVWLPELRDDGVYLIGADDQTVILKLCRPDRASDLLLAGYISGLQGMKVPRKVSP